MFIPIIVTLIEKCDGIFWEILFLSFQVNIYKIQAHTN